MKLLLVRPGPSFSVSDVHRGWLRALKAVGVTVADLNYDERLAFYTDARRVTKTGDTIAMLDSAGAVRLASKGISAACFEWLPDALMVISCFYVPCDILDAARGHGIKVVLVHTESPYEDERQIERAAHADLNIVNDPTNIGRFRQAAPTIYLPHCYDPDVHYPADEPPDIDFCFVGTGYPTRVEFLEQVDWDGLDIALGGNWQRLTDDSPIRKHLVHDIGDCISNDQAADLYRASRASANLYRREADRPELAAGWAMGPREVELAACETFYMTEARGENRDILPMVPTFETPDEFTEKLRWHLDRPDVMSRIAEQAAAAVADRTFDTNAIHLMRALSSV